MDKSVYVTLRMPESLRARLQAEADRDNRSVSAVIRMAVESHLSAVRA